ncbi:hypothetical protein [Pseudoduganella albidiflava]|uniref:Uncharacterized protein n=1 Tax=Pseudoduganella albidiflava TaxID=321983 RepID=A0A411X609_9BURK|nr:hypothetical protein [Pseudoduganella albidiflava]QBI04466.1 hypothetical protein EYF70_29310 [Pseudoduganella albidiflava]GGY27484.1 hypothetical protein GCM10007387_06930 [Pseudoduganella albidiflava]
MSQIRTFLSGATTMAATLAAVFALTGAKTERQQTFDEITVGRINIVEPDGTKRLVISNRARFPGDFKQGKEGARPDRRSFAGMLFINEEGTENGGLIQKGSIGADGQVSSGLSLTFDRFRQDQALQLLSHDSASRQTTAVLINDVPDFKVTSMDDLTRFREEARKLPEAERRPYWNKLTEEGRLGANRVWLGNTGDKGSSLQLKDARGRTRMLLLVSADGKAQIQMLDEQGKVVKSIEPGSPG